MLNEIIFIQTHKQLILLLAIRNPLYSLKYYGFCVASAGASDLLRQQNTDKMNLEKELLSEEDKSLSTKLQALHAEKQRVLDEAAEALAQQLQG